MSSTSSSPSSCTLQLINCTGLPLLPGANTKGGPPQMSTWTFGAIAPKTSMNVSIVFPSSGAVWPAATQTFTYNGVNFIQLQADNQAPNGNFLGNLVGFDFPQGSNPDTYTNFMIGLTSNGPFLGAGETDILGAGENPVGWMPMGAWPLSNPPNNPGLFQLSASQSFGFVIVDLMAIFPADKATEIYGASVSNYISPDQRKALYAAVTSAVAVDRAAWMTRSWSVIAGKPLSSVCVPGTHDSGTAVTTYSTVGSTNCNTQTQALTIQGQLNAGARYFDMRPCYLASKNAWYLTHCSEHLEGWWGAAGQSLQSAISDVLTFIQQPCGANELIILKLSHSWQLNTWGREKLSTNQYSEMVGMVTSPLEDYLFKATTSVNLNQQKLSTLTAGGKHVLAVFDIGGGKDPGLPPSLVSPSTGVFAYGDTGDSKIKWPATPNLYMYDVYAKTDDFKDMVSNQKKKLQQFQTSSQRSFLLSWTLTCDLTSDCISEMAQKADSALPGYMEDWIKDGTISATKIPNVLYIDYLGQYNDDTVNLSMKFNGL